MSWQPPPSGYGSPPGGYPAPGSPVPPGYPGGYPPSGSPIPPGYPGGYPVPGYPGGHPYPGYPVGAYAMQGAPGPALGLVYAGFWWRFLGYILDSLILGVPIGIVAAIIASNLQWASHPTTVCSGGVCNTTFLAPPAGWPLGPAIGYAICVGLVDLLYFGVLVSMWGSTVGQRAIGSRVVREEAPAHSLPMGRALARAAVFWGPTLLGFVAWLGALAGLGEFICLLWVAWDPRKQGLHDKLGRAVVVRRSPAPVLVPVTPPYPYQQGYVPPYPAPAPPPQPPQGPPASWAP